MKPSVFFWSDNHKVLNPVVQGVPVDMVNEFSPPKFSPEMLFHNKTMLSYPDSIDVSSGILGNGAFLKSKSGINDESVFGTTGSRTEKGNGSPSRLNVKLFPTKGALYGCSSPTSPIVGSGARRATSRAKGIVVLARLILAEFLSASYAVFVHIVHLAKKQYHSPLTMSIAYDTGD